MTLSPLTLTCVAGILKQDNRFLIAKRPLHKPHGGFWEFSGGKTEKNETAIEALARELLEELGVIIDQGQTFYLTTLENHYDNKKVCISVYTIFSWKNDPRPLEGQVLRWVTLDELNTIHQNSQKKSEKMVKEKLEDILFLPGLNRILPLVSMQGFYSS